MKHGSLFSGIGGFDLAAEWMGWQNVFHCEWVPSKQEVLQRNFPNSVSYGNIQEFDAIKYNGKIDIISGGFPCQDISIANQSKLSGPKNIKGERSGLWKEYARVVREIGPGIIVFENSPMLLSRGLEVILCDLSELGYDCEWRLFYATQFGFPHLRERLYGVAYSRVKRWKNIIEDGGILQKILPERTPRQKPVSVSFKRFNSKSSYENVRMDDGFSEELDKEVIHGFGNAVVPHIPYAIFKSIEEYERGGAPNGLLQHTSSSYSDSRIHGPNAKCFYSSGNRTLGSDTTKLYVHSQNIWHFRRHCWQLYQTLLPGQNQRPYQGNNPTIKYK